jgi:integrase
VRHVDGDTLTVPAGKTGARIVTLTDEGATFLAKVAGKRAPGEPLFVRTDDGTRWGKSEQHRPMKRALKAAGLPASASVYSLRHSHISRAIESGVPLTLIAENCGTSVRMIELSYAKVLAATRRKLIQKAGPALRLVRAGART